MLPSAEENEYFRAITKRTRGKRTNEKEKRRTNMSERERRRRRRRRKESKK